MAVIFITLGDFDPDGSEYAEDTVHVARNVLPVHRTWRALRKLTPVAELNSTDPIIRAYGHPWESQSPKQIASPRSTARGSAWLYPGQTEGRDPGGLHAHLATQYFDDATYITSPGSPSSAPIRFLLDLMQEPPDSDHVFYFRCKVFGNPSTYTLVGRLLTDGQTVVATKTITEADEAVPTGWKTYSYDLTAAEIATLNQGDYESGVLLLEGGGKVFLEGGGQVLQEGAAGGTGLQFEFLATCDGAAQAIDPIADSDAGEWENELGGVTGLFGNVTDGNDATYAISQPLAAGATDSIRFRLAPTFTPAEIYSTLLKLRRYATNTGVEMRARVFDGDQLLLGDPIDGDPQQLTEAAWSNIAVGSVEAVDLPLGRYWQVRSDRYVGTTLAYSEWSEVNWGGLVLEITAVAQNPLPASTVWATDDPGSDVSNDDWSLEGTGTGVFDRLADSDDANYVKSPTGTTDKAFEIDMANSFDLDASSINERQIVVRCENTHATLARNLTLEIVENGAVAATKVFSIAAASGVLDKTWDIESETAITDFDGMRMRFKASNNETVRVMKVRLQLAASRRLVLPDVAMEFPSGNYIGVSWQQLQTPEATSDSTAQQFDQLTLLAMTRKSVYTVDPLNGFVDVSGTTFAESARSWDVCSFGEYAILTNYADAVQKFADGDSTTSNLITSSTKPKARWCAVFGDQLALGDINLAGRFADEVMISVIDDAADFDTAASGATSQRLTKVPGQIMRLVGGDVPLIFKRSGILRGEYIGAPEFWAFYVVSDQIGTDQPWSVIKYGNDVFFKGQGAGEGWYAVRSGIVVEPVDERVRKHFFDRALGGYLAESVGRSGGGKPPPQEYGPIYEDGTPVGGVKGVFRSDPRIMENRVIGDVCGATGLIFWPFRGGGDAEYRNTQMAVLSPAANGERFSTVDLLTDNDDPLLEDGSQILLENDTTDHLLLEDPATTVSAIASLRNIENDANHFIRGVGLFSFDGFSAVRYEQFKGEEIYDVGLGKKVFQFHPRDDAMSRLEGVRPIFRDRSLEAQPVAQTRYTRGVSVIVETADDAQLEKNYRRTELTADEANDDGWMRCSLAAKFATFELKLSGFARRATTEITGIQLDVKKDSGR